MKRWFGSIFIWASILGWMLALLYILLVQYMITYLELILILGIPVGLLILGFKFIQDQ